MWLKVVIVVLFIALCISLFSGLFFLFKDRGTTMRTWQSLSVRLALATALMGFLFYGVYIYVDNLYLNRAMFYY